MTASEHVLILLSLIISLALAQVLSGLARLIQARGVRWSALHAVWVFYTFLILIDYWISVWQLRLQDVWTIWQVFFWVALAVLHYLFAALVVPSRALDGGIDLGDFHERNRSRYLSIFLLSMAFAFSANLMLEGFASANLVIIVNVFCLIAAGFARQRWLQWAGTIGTGVLFAIYFAIFMGNIQQF